MNKISSKNIYNRWVILTLLFGILVTCAVAYRTQDANEKRIAEAVDQSSNQVMEEVVSRIQLYQYGLRGARGVLLTTGENEITRDIFSLYSETRDVDVEFPGARGFGFIRRVPQVDAATFILSASQDGWPDFAIKTLFPNFNEHYVIQYIEPIERNYLAIGLDIASEKNRREAATSSLYTGEVRLTGPITLVQASGKAQQSVLILMPIYRGGKVPETLDERLEAGFGWSYAPLLMEEVLSHLNIDVEKIHYELFDVTDLDDKIRFYDSGELQNRQNETSQSRRIYGRNWESHLSVSPAYIADLHLPNPFSFLIIGVFISVLGAVLVAAVIVNISRHREVIAHQSRIAAVVESSADGIISKSLEGVIVSWNKGAESIFGYTQEEAIGQLSFELLVPSDLLDEDKTILSSVIDNKKSIIIETRRKTKSGSDVPIALTVSPIFDSNRLVVGVSNSVRDISERKKAEAKIRDLNSSLESQVKERTLELHEINLLLNDVLDASSEIAIIATDMDGKINLFNSGAQRMLGYSAEEAVGQMTPLSFHAKAEVVEERDAIFETTGTYVTDLMEVLIFKALRNNYESKEWTYIDKYEKAKPVSLVITPMKNSDDEVIGFLGMAVDITAQKASQHALVSTRDQLLMAAEVAQLGVWTWNLENNLLDWNETMFDIYQYPRTLKNEGVTYAHWYSRVHPEDRDASALALQNAIKGIGEYDLVMRLLLPDGNIRYVQTGASIERNTSGKAIAVAGINRDITAERNLEAWLRKAKDEADAASAAKSSFLANMSHEIRTPMNAILGMLELVKRTALTHQQDDYVSKAHISAKSLLGLINDILDFSKVDAGKLTLESVPFEIENLLYELSTVLSGSSLENNVELIFDIDKDIPPYLVGDKLRLLQVLINLVSNAVKFTLEGSVILEIKQTALESGVSRLTVSITDTGIGISADQIESIFEVFSQAESSTTRRFGGSGLGLVICRRFVALMGGVLNVESTLGVGSRFHFTIDLPVAEAPVEKILNVQARKPIRLLIVDNNLASQAILTRIAINLGWFYEKAETLKEIVTLVNKAAENGGLFDVVLLDIKTSDFVGRDSIEHMVASFHSSIRPPKIILLASTPNEKLEASLELASSYLLKPTTLSQLSETVYESLFHSETLLDDSNKKFNDRIEEHLAGIKLLLVEDNAFNRQVATELLAAEGAIVTVAEGGLEGVTAVLDSGEGAFDLVLMDMQMPDIDGLEATRQIRKNGQFTSLPIVAMTANVSEEDRQACLNAGMNDHLGKPLDIDLMIACILQYVGKKTQLDVTLDRVAETAIRTEDNHSYEREDIQSILSRFGGSVDLFRSVVDGFVAESQDLLENIDKNVTDRDQIKARETLHTLKGASLTMGLLHFSNQLSGFEQVLKTTEDKEALETCFSSINVAELHIQLHDELATIIAEINDLT